MFTPDRPSGMPDANNPADNPDLSSPRQATPLPPQSGMLPAFPESQSGGLPTSPGIPSGMLPTEAPAPDSQPSQIPSGPPQMPGAVPPAASAPAVRPLVRPLPLWARLTGTALLIAGLVTVFVTRQVQGNDWADGVLYAALAAAALAGLLLLVMAARMLAGMASSTNPLRPRQLASASVLLGVLLVFAGEGITLQAPVHHLHAFVLEHQQQWENALAQFRLAGQRPPDSRDLARTYAEWGEQLSASSQYDLAIANFDVVIHTYTLAAPEVQRAQTDEIATYFTWANQAVQDHDFMGATTRYDALLMQSFCSGDCRTRASALDATAYYNLAEMSLSQQDYSTAVNAFQALQTRFSDSPEAQKIHADFARALLGLGQQQRQQSPCPDAIATYQNLIQHFPDTPEGQQATIDYKAPEPVTGQFTGSVISFNGGQDLVFLLRGASIGMSDSQLVNLVNQAISAGRVAQIPFGTTTFTFRPVPQGTYVLTWAALDPATGLAYIRRPANDGTQFTYVASVGPLCNYNFGNIPENVPLN